MTKEFYTKIKDQFPFLLETKVLVACSGGLDSMVLSYLCMKVGLQIGLAHCNFKLRGLESDGDERFVQEFGAKNKVPVYIKSFEAEHYGKVQRLSTQMAARELRYNWFRDLLAKEDYEYVLTAHHSNDNLETFLINLIRGTGLDGLTGIPEQNEHYVRPLLDFTRDEIEVCAKAYGIPWREDSSNRKEKYVRNKIRHSVIPVLEDLNPAMLSNFQRTIDHLRDGQNIIADTVRQLQSDLFVNNDDNATIRIPISDLQQLRNRSSYLYYLLKDYGFTAWEDVNKLLEAQSGKEIRSQSHRLIKDRQELLLSPIKIESSSAKYELIQGETAVLLPNKVIKLNRVNQIGENSPQTIFIDADKIEYPIIIRRWQQGDSFKPKGMEGTKKLSKYFKDEKLSLLDKERVWVLCSKDQIVWIVGYRADARFDVTAHTHHILKISTTV